MRIVHSTVRGGTVAGGAKQHIERMPLTRVNFCPWIKIPGECFDRMEMRQNF